MPANKLKFVEDMTEEDFKEIMDEPFDPVTLDIDAEIAEAMKDPEFKRIWEENAPEREARELFLTMRDQANLTQEEIAKQLHTTRSAISRMESVRHSTSLKQFLRYANACGFKVELKPIKKQRKRKKDAAKAK